VVNGLINVASTVDILVRSYYKDFGWLSFCLRAIAKYCHGVRDVVVVVPEGSGERLRLAGVTPAHVQYCPQFPDDYLGQQVTKLYADTYTDADFIIHVDSDCIFRRTCSPTDLCKGERPHLLVTSCSQFPDKAPWQIATERFLKSKIGYDFMRRQPLMYPRWIYGELRQYALNLHKQELADYVLDRPPLGFSEFNALGAFAYSFYRSAFHWVETDEIAFDEQFCRIFWSREGLHEEHQYEIESILGLNNTLGSSSGECASEEESRPYE
jgi:hypothetical protein